MYRWKIEPFEIPSTDRTQAPKTIVAIEIGYWDGKVTVSDADYSPVMLVIDYYDNDGRKRDYLQDRVDVNTIRTKGVAMELEGEVLEGFVKMVMDKIVKNLIGGVTRAERCAALTELAQMFGQVVLAEEYQTGSI